MSQKKEHDRFSVSIPPEINETFEVLRRKLNLSRSDAVHKAMRLFINQQSDSVPELFEGNVLGTITYIEKAHIHGHPHDSDSTPHYHGDVSHIHGEEDTYYLPVDKLEFVKATELEHEYLDVIISTTHIHAGPEKCMLIISVKGAYPRVQELIEKLSAFKTIENIQFSIVEKY